MKIHTGEKWYLGKRIIFSGMALAMTVCLFASQAAALNWDGLPTTMLDDPRGGLPKRALVDNTSGTIKSSGGTVNVYDYNTFGPSTNVTGNVYGGLGAGTISAPVDATGNMVSIYNSGLGNGGTGQSIDVKQGSGSIYGADSGSVFGGASMYGNASNNTVYIGSNGGLVPALWNGNIEGYVTGGFALGTSGDATGNKVFISSGTVLGRVSGGTANGGNALNNHVMLSGGTMTGHNLYGGYSLLGNADGNSITVTGKASTPLDTDVYYLIGGYSNTVGSVHGNKVIVGLGAGAAANSVKVGGVVGGSAVNTSTSAGVGEWTLAAAP